MEKRKAFVNGKNFFWKASQDSEHPDMTILEPDNHIHVQVVLSELDKKHNERFLQGKEESPISDDTASKIVQAVVSRGYLMTYKSTGVGLIFDESFNLIEN